MKNLNLQKDTNGGNRAKLDNHCPNSISISSKKQKHKDNAASPSRSSKPAQSKWKGKMGLDPLKIKGRWTAEEDSILSELVRKHGTKRWRFIASQLNGRLPKQCRERWCNQLDPNIRKDSLTEEEWTVVKKIHDRYGNRWAEIARQIPGRTANHIKNQWNTMLRRLSMDADNESIDRHGEHSAEFNRKLRLRSSPTPVYTKTSEYSSDEDQTSQNDFDPLPFSKKSKLDTDQEQTSSTSQDHTFSQGYNPPATSDQSFDNFSAFTALVDASCEVLNQQTLLDSNTTTSTSSDPSTSQMPLVIPTLISSFHPMYYVHNPLTKMYSPIVYSLNSPMKCNPLLPRVY
ncbi:transcriptional activator Myb-like [Schistocerca gregaria]|uniref:transcriptional activator Myb-like n=1 Tax=Schistocerca gregaria TaxID=7010 RepID=UPI00211E863C|nr:transcriptional activator Myb-like [Schistocerca gregaria]